MTLIKGPKRRVTLREKKNRIHIATMHTEYISLIDVSTKIVP